MTYHLYFLLHADWPTHPLSRSRHHGNNIELTKVPECYPLDVFILQYSLWTESWNLRDYDTRRAFMYPLIERKPVQANNEHRILDYKTYWVQKYRII